jgi:hypothetical protein
VTYFEVLSQYLSEVLSQYLSEATKETNEKPEDMLSQSQIWNIGPPEYKVGVVTTRQQRLIKYIYIYILKKS